MNELATATAVAANLENNHSYELQYHCAAMVLNIKTLEHGKYLRNSATSCSTECSLAAEWLHSKFRMKKPAQSCKILHGHCQRRRGPRSCSQRTIMTHRATRGGGDEASLGVVVAFWN